MVLVQVFNVFTRDDVYFGVPVRIEVVEGGELPFLLLCQVGKVFQDKFHCCVMSYKSYGLWVAHVVQRHCFVAQQVLHHFVR